MTHERLPTSEVPASDVVETASMRTRDKIFRAIGNTVEITTDTAVFGAKATGYSLGKTLQGIGQSIYGLLKGITDKEFPHSR